MRADIMIAAEPRHPRQERSPPAARGRHRRPAVVYGAGTDAVAVAVNPKEMTKILHRAAGHNTIFNLASRAAKIRPVMIVDWQYDPVKDNLLHVDLQRIDLTKRHDASGSGAHAGDPKGVKIQGGLHEVITREIEIECLPDESRKSSRWM